MLKPRSFIFASSWMTEIVQNVFQTTKIPFGKEVIGNG